MSTRGTARGAFVRSSKSATVVPRSLTEGNKLNPERVPCLGFFFVARRPPWVLTKEEGMSDDRTKADKAWEARQEAARYRIFNAATNAAEATDEADDENYFAVLDQAGNAAEAAAAEITGTRLTPTC